MDWLSHTVMNDWLPATLPPSFLAFHKWGANGTVSNDIGLVAGPGAHYALVIFTDGTHDGGALIRALSAEVVRAYPASTIQ